MAAWHGGLSQHTHGDFRHIAGSNGVEGADMVVHTPPLGGLDNAQSWLHFHHMGQNRRKVGGLEAHRDREQPGAEGIFDNLLPHLVCRGWGGQGTSFVALVGGYSARIHSHILGQIAPSQV